MKDILPVIFVLLAFSGCKKSDSPVSQNPEQLDLSLEGNWENTGAIYQYVDSISLQPLYTDTVPGLTTVYFDGKNKATITEDSITIDTTYSVTINSKNVDSIAIPFQNLPFSKYQLSLKNDSLVLTTNLYSVPVTGYNVYLISTDTSYYHRVYATFREIFIKQ